MPKSTTGYNCLKCKKFFANQQKAEKHELGCIENLQVLLINHPVLVLDPDFENSSLTQEHYTDVGISFCPAGGLVPKVEYHLDAQYHFGQIRGFDLDTDDDGVMVLMVNFVLFTFSDSDSDYPLEHDIIFNSYEFDTVSELEQGLAAFLRGEYFFGLIALAHNEEALAAVKSRLELIATTVIFCQNLLGSLGQKPKQ